MKTIIIQTLESSLGVHPKAGFNNIRLKRVGDGSGMLNVSFGLTGASVGNPVTVHIEGGVFVADPELGEETTTLVRTTANIGAVYVKVTSDEAYIRLPEETRFSWRQTEEAYFDPENSPLVDYSFNIRGLNAVTNMFQGSSHFNSPVDAVGRALPGLTTTTFTNMFSGASSFDQDISDWDMSIATVAGGMFRGARMFNQDISGWNVSNITDMAGMFADASAFDQDLTGWNFHPNVALTNFLDRSGMSAENYSKLLEALAGKDWTGRTRTKVLGALGVRYDEDGQGFRDALVADGWTITDGGMLNV